MKDLSKYDHIPTEEVENDLKDTYDELENIQSQNDLLNKFPMENKLTIYMNQGRIKEREDFISFLKSLLKYRGINL